jgi:hypothetical protein
MYSSTMKVEVELKYRAVPPEEEFEIIREAGRGLTTDPKSVGINLSRDSLYGRLFRLSDCSGLSGSGQFA